MIRNLEKHIISDIIIVMMSTLKVIVRPEIKTYNLITSCILYFQKLYDFILYRYVFCLINELLGCYQGLFLPQ